MREKGAFKRIERKHPHRDMLCRGGGAIYIEQIVKVLSNTTPVEQKIVLVEQN